MITTVEEAIKALKLNFDALKVEGDNDREYEATLAYNFDISPEEFLEFAIEDVEKPNKRGLVNALSNAKRAIDCQVDKILFCFGIRPDKSVKILQKLNLPRLNDLPAKMQVLQEIGIVAPRVIRKVVQKRNYLEHEYKCPEQEQVEDAVDIAQLFIEASNKTLHTFAGFAIYDHSDDKQHKAIFVDYKEEEDEGKFMINVLLEDIPAIGGSKGLESIFEEALLDYYSVPMARLAIALKNNRRRDEAIHNCTAFLHRLSS